MRRALIATLSYALCGFGSCTVSTRDLCDQKLPEFTQSVQVILQEISPAHGGRSLASLRTGAPSDSGPKPVDRVLWSEEKLLEVQRYRDAMEGDERLAPTRDLISKIADDLVAFHGYAEQESRESNRQRMRVTLQRMESKTEKLRRQVCVPHL